MINGHGNNIYQFAENGIEIDFSSNIAFNSHSEQICDYLRGVVGSIENYPDPECRELREALASRLSVSQSELLVTNGSAEAFYLIAHHLRRTQRIQTAIVTPSFAEYEDSCRVYDHELSFITFEQLFTSDLTAYTSVWLGLPNNPDGVRVDLSAVRTLARRYSECYFVVDRAYNELSAEAEREWETESNIVVVDSFTKAYGVPGVRLGYLMAERELVASVASLRVPWSVNSLSQRAGLYILEHSQELQFDREELIGESRYLQREIAKLERFRVTPSDCNFFLVEIVNCEANSADLMGYLVEEHHILIRDCSNFRGLTTRHFRLAAQRREACDRLITALKLWR